MTRTARVQLATAAIVCLWSTMTNLAAQSPPPTLCSGPAAEADAPDLGIACSAVYNDTKATRDQRVEALFFRGIWHHRANRLEAAARDYDAALELDPDHAKILQLRANLFITSRQLGKAKRLALRSAKIDPGRSKTFEQLALIAIREGELAEALAYLNTALELRPDNIYSRFERAAVLVTLDRAGEAIVDTQWLLDQPTATVDKEGTRRVDGQVVGLYLASFDLHGKILRQLDRYEEAEAHYNRMVAEQRSAFTLTQRSSFFQRLPIGAGMRSRAPEALADIEEAVRLDPKNGRAHLRLASLMEYAKRYQEALFAVDQALQYEKFGDWVPPATWQRARVLRALGRTDEAVTAARSSLRLALRANPRFLNHQLERLAPKGYWLQPESEDQLEKALDDAAAACMADDQCW